MALRGNLVTPFRTIEQGQIEVKDSKIMYVGPRRPCNGVVDHGDAVIAPGFIDIHVHGIAGHDAMDPETGSLQHISQSLASKGVTGFLATLQTAPQKELLEALAANFKGFESIRNQLLFHTPKYGNDDDFADLNAKEIFQIFYDSINGRPTIKGGTFRINLLPTTSHVYFGSVIGALPDDKLGQQVVLLVEGLHIRIGEFQVWMVASRFPR